MIATDTDTDTDTSVHDARMFQYDKETHKFSQEASTLQLQPGQTPSIVTIKNFKTGNVVDFSLFRTFYNREGDVESWKYAGSFNGQQYFLVIWND